MANAKMELVFAIPLLQALIALRPCVKITAQIMLLIPLAHV